MTYNKSGSMQKDNTLFILILFIFAFYFCALQCEAQAKDISTWVKALKSDATKTGIRGSTFDLALSDFQPIDRVIELDRNQPEFTLTFDQYIRRVLPERRVIKGKKKFLENKTILRKIGKKYGVQPRFIVAFWGIETDFGGIDGGFPVIRALATLAFDGRRSKFFRGQLLAALGILDQGHITLKKMRGSWAGLVIYPSGLKAHGQAPWDIFSLCLRALQLSQLTMTKMGGVTYGQIKRTPLHPPLTTFPNQVGGVTKPGVEK